MMWYKTFHFILLLLSFSCDFTPQLHKDILLAQKSIQEQKYEESILRYKEIFKKNPPIKIKIKICYQLGELYTIHLGAPKEGKKYFKEVLKITDDPSWLIKIEEKLGDVDFTYIKNYKEASKHYEKLVNFIPKLKNTDFYQYRLGLAYLNSKENDKAKKIFSKILENKDHNFFVISNFKLGLTYFHSKMWEDALNYFKKYLKIELNKGKQVQTKFLMANSYEMLEKLGEAYDIYYSLQGEYPHPDVIENKLKSLYSRRIARKR